MALPHRGSARPDADGLVHVAGTHLRGPGSQYNIGPAAELLPGGGEVIGFCSWQEGLALRPGLTDGISSVGDAARRGLRLVNREPGAEGRSLLDRELTGARIYASQVPGYDTQVTGHLQVAAAIAACLAHAGIASEPAALAYDLAFIPLAAEHFDLVTQPASSAAAKYRACSEYPHRRGCSTRWQLPGHDPARCGERIATLPAR